MSVLDFDQARHLVSRTGFGPELNTIQQFHEKPRQQVINSLLNTPRDFMLPPPALHDFLTIRSMRKASHEQKKAANKLVRQDIKKVQGWALEQALQNPNALQEKMTWFWHNHFTSSGKKSRRTADFLLGQSLLIRKHALGNFADLLRAIPYDPLMLIYLDGTSNVRAKPNENFARELLELFTLGEGHYSEQDIKEIARAFTGWRINGKTGEVVKRKKRFDNGIKTVFGQSGAFDSDDIIELLLAHPRTAEWIAEKMWSAFISITPPDTTITKQWANEFRDSNYEISVLLQAVLFSDVFWHPAAKATLLKSPLDLVIGTLRTLDLEDNDLPLRTLSNQLKRMGQNLYHPPNVKGWPGGMNWVDDFTLPIRQQFIRRLTRASNKQHNTMMQNARPQMTTQKQNLRLTALPELTADYWESWLLPQQAVTTPENPEPRRYLQAILLDPAYQLK
ncbi:MAG: DUF1800 domain-containing protein [Thiolinea sp.]